MAPFDVYVGTKLSEISATVTDPAGVEDRCDISDDSPGVYQVLFKPRETGVHFISVTNQRSPVPGTLHSLTIYCLRPRWLGSVVVRASDL